MGWPDRASQPGLRLRGPEMSRVTGCSTRAARQVRWPSRLCPWFSLRRRGVALHQPRTSRSMLRRQRQRAAREGRARTSRAKPALPMLSKIAASAAQLSALSRSPPPAARRRQMEHRHRARVNPTTTLTRGGRSTAATTPVGSWYGSSRFGKESTVRKRHSQDLPHPLTNPRSACLMRLDKKGKEVVLKNTGVGSR